MIEKGSDEWIAFLRSIEYSKSKSNRDVLCVECWKMMKYEESVKHKLIIPDHSKFILSSKFYASEHKFTALAKSLGKVHKDD